MGSARFQPLSGAVFKQLFGLNCVEAIICIIIIPINLQALLPRIQIPNLPYIAAVALRSANIIETGNVLEARGVNPIRATDKFIVVGPEDAAGAYMIFHAPGIESVWPYMATV